MKIKAGIYIGIAIALIVGGTLLTVNGKDAVSQAESRKQGILEAEQTTITNKENQNYYTDLYIQESEIQKLEVNQNIDVHFPYLEHPTKVTGVVTSISAAPQFASLRMTREKGQADLSMFLVRISIDSTVELLPGMTAEVRLNELSD